MLEARWIGAAGWIARAGLALAMAACGLSDATADAPDDGPDPAGTDSAAVCSDPGGGGEWRMRCLARVQIDSSTGRFKAHLAAPRGLGADDLQGAYSIDPTKTKTASPKVGLVNAFGYTALESDLAMYRAQYSLPVCNVANGCLTIVNQQGQASPLPANPPMSNDWTVEAALDLDMVSAACPLCKIVIVEANSDSSTDLFAAESIAASMTPDVISNSWGGAEQGDVRPFEKYFDHGDIAIFTAAGDDGYNDQFATTKGPDYPGTSGHVISVGATRLERATLTSRGWTETAWAVSGTKMQSAGGSACSLSIAKPAYQTASPCTFKATADISAVGDPTTGVAVYNAGNAGWLVAGGTSAASPFVAGVYAATGNGKQTSGAFLAANPTALNDVTSGNNGTCDNNSILCNAATGWDGPTGYGTPNGAALLAIGGGGGSGTTGGGTTGSGGGTTGDSGGGCCSTTGTGAGGTGTGLLVALGALLTRRRRR
ncbi:MAG TPA: S53 family peptidase [Kofleriaceae bacterium]